MRYLLGFIGIIVGILILKYKEAVRDAVGDIDWAERALGAGGTWSAIVLTGVATIILSIMYMAGSFQSIFMSLFGKFFI